MAARTPCAPARSPRSCSVSPIGANSLSSGMNATWTGIISSATTSRNSRVTEREMQPREGVGRHRGQRHGDQRRRDRDDQGVDEGLDHALTAEHLLVVLEREAERAGSSPTSRSTWMSVRGRNDVTSRPIVGRQPDQGDDPQGDVDRGLVQELDDPLAGGPLASGHLRLCDSRHLRNPRAAEAPDVEDHDRDQQDEHDHARPRRLAELAAWNRLVRTS